MIVLFCNLHKDKILGHVNPLLSDAANAKWMLELSNTALSDLLSDWGEELTDLEVSCDASKPIADQIDTFNQMVGRADKLRLRLGNIDGSITYNLASPIKIVDSRTHPGVQLADVFSSSLCYALNNQDDSYCVNLIKEYLPTISERSVAPDFSHLDLTTEHAFINSVLLLTLIERSCRGEDLYSNLRELVMSARQSYPLYKLELDEEGYSDGKVTD
jgi:hypothetical protein